ncbi:MAG: IS3 family transposase, partial [bacterium]|nr:IS3 family transposase [bacterium]
QMVLDLIDAAVCAGARLELACETIGLSARTIQRWREQGGGCDRRHGPHSEPANKLSAAERQEVLEIVNSPQYCDLSPNQIVPRLADAGIYVASEATMYRLLREVELLAHHQRSRPAVRWRPREHVATGPCQVFSWDITYLRSPVRGSFFYLYLILDVWSRKIMGAKVYGEESMDLASELFEQTCRRHDLDPEGVVLHSDNGGPMKGSTMLATLQRLGVVASFSRPRVSDDNPYSEALFRTLKYRPGYPCRPFASLEEARLWVEGFVRWYNTEHLHSAIRFVTPDDRHYGREQEILSQRHRVYERARRRNPRRWSGATRNWQPIKTVYLNPEKKSSAKDLLAAA